MGDKVFHCNFDTDESKAYQDIEELIGQSSPELVWALYCVSAGVVRENIAAAVIKHIASGNKGLKAAFPEFAQVRRAK